MRLSGSYRREGFTLPGDKTALAESLVLDVRGMPVLQGAERMLPAAYAMAEIRSSAYHLASIGQ